jgi:putative tryptophan/tyrosine transport system substrate-binding protein
VFRQGLRGLGWVEGENIVFEYRFAEGQLDRLPALATELVRLKVDVILAGSIPGALAAKNATGTIPVVMVTTGDPVTSGLVASFARPGGNVTGVTALTEALSGKRLQLLKEAVPGVARVAILATQAYPDNRTASAQLRALHVRDPGEFEQAFATVRREGAGALMMGTDPMFITHRRQLVALAAKVQLPTIYGLRGILGGRGTYVLWRKPAPHV